jgi:hypothetical protein
LVTDIFEVVVDVTVVVVVVDILVVLIVFNVTVVPTDVCPVKKVWYFNSSKYVNWQTLLKLCCSLYNSFIDYICSCFTYEIQCFNMRLLNYAKGKDIVAIFFNN